MVGAISMAASALMAASARAGAAASNIANAQTVGAVDGSPAPYQPLLTVQTPAPGGGVAAQVMPSQAGARPLHAPFHPFADTAGMVAEPAVDLASEVVNLSQTMAAFRANLAMVRTADEVERALLETRA